MTETTIAVEATMANGPVTGKERNKALDVTRGFAVLGILLVNIYFAAMPINSVMFLFFKPDVLAADMHAWTFMQVGLIGVSRGLFSLMFGAGMMLLLDRLKDRFEGKKLRNFFFKRMGILYVIGLVHIFGFMWFGDILNVYALCGMILYFFRNASTRKLAIAAVIFALIASVIPVAMSFGISSLSQLEQKEANGQSLTEDEITLKEALKEAFDPLMNPQKILEDDKVITEKMLGDFRETYIAVALISLEFLPTNFILVLWDSLFMMVIGIWMFRKGWLTGEAKPATYVKMTVIGLGVGLGIRGYWFYQFWQQEYAMDYVMLNFVAAQPTRLFIAVGVIGAVQLFIRATFWQSIKNSIASVGQMALSNYMAHSIIFAFVFYGFGLGLYNSLTGWQVFGLGLLIFIAQMIVSPIWLKYYRFGPIEWLWRSLTYGERQLMRRV